MINKPLTICILAAGKGTRMNSSMPKVLHEINGIPLAHFVIKTSKLLNPKKIILIVGYKKDLVKKSVKKFNIEFAEQNEQKGTAHAVEQCLSKLRGFSGDTLILSGDVPLISQNTLNQLITLHQKNKSLASILSANIINPKGYGRIIRNNNNFIKIVEHKDANTEELKINEINSGIYIFDTKTLYNKISLIKNNNIQGEYYLTDIFEFIDKNMISIYNTNHIEEINGINTINQLNDIAHQLVK
tara:strand:- start:750 stop:1478 length:729 start_codon:yes stop_codon:yes gene_type:complete